MCCTNCVRVPDLTFEQWEIIEEALARYSMDLSYGDDKIKQAAVHDLQAIVDALH